MSSRVSQMWCVETERDFDASLRLVDEDGNVQVEEARQFLLWLGEVSCTGKVVVDEDGRDRTVSFETFDQATKWIKMVCDKRLEDIGKSSLPKRYVISLPGMEALKKRVTCAQRASNYAECTETSQRSDLVLTFEEMRTIADGTLSASKVRILFSC